MSALHSALAYWFESTVRPRQAMVALKKDEKKVSVTVWINLIFALLYAVTALIYTAIGRRPAVPPWAPVPEEQYYLYQAFWTVPWAFATWVMFSGIAHLLASAGKRQPRWFAFEDALAVCGLGWVVPSTILMWIPETLLVPIFGVFWPEWVEILRLMVLPPLWQSLLVALGLRETHEVGWVWGIVIGAVTVAVFFVSFLAYMR